MKSTRFTAVAAAVTAAALVLVGCGSSDTPTTSSSTTTTSSSAVATTASSSESSSSAVDSSSSGTMTSASETAAPGGDPGSVIIGSANFGESELLMNLYGQALEAKGVTVELKPQIGSREIYMQAVLDGSVDLVPEYSGALLTYFNGENTVADSAGIYAALPDAIDPSVKILDQSSAEDKDSISVTEATATQYNLKTIADLAPVAGDLILGASPEFESRPNGVLGLKDVYEVEFGTFTGTSDAVTALLNGQIDAANLYTTDTSITTNKFVVLEDPENLFPAENVLPLIRSDKTTPTIESALNALSAELTTEDLIDMNGKVAAGTDSAIVAKDWLTEKGLI